MPDSTCTSVRLNGISRLRCAALRCSGCSTVLSKRSEVGGSRVREGSRPSSHKSPSRFFLPTSELRGVGDTVQYLLRLASGADNPEFKSDRILSSSIFLFSACCNLVLNCRMLSSLRERAFRTLLSTRASSALCSSATADSLSSKCFLWLPNSDWRRQSMDRIRK